MSDYDRTDSPDERRRKRERTAQEGVDPVANVAAATDAARLGPEALCDTTIFRGLFGTWVRYEAGPNFAECGVLRDMFIDELGRGVAILDHVRRQDNETDEGPTWLNKEPGIDDQRVPTTAVTHCGPAAKRWGPNFEPWV